MLSVIYNNYKSSWQFSVFVRFFVFRKPRRRGNIQSFHYLLKDETQDVDLLSQDLAALARNNLPKTLQPAEMVV